MKRNKALLLGILVLATSSGAWAQNDDKYLDDAYLSSRDMERLRERERHEAQLRREAAIKARREWEAKQATLMAEYKRKKRQREIDAYNGHESEENALLDEEIAQLLNATSSRKQGDVEVSVYGPYSDRLLRFHTDGTVIINDPDAVYINGQLRYHDSWGSSRMWLTIGNPWWYDSWYPWYSYGHHYAPWYYGYGYYPSWHYRPWRPYPDYWWGGGFYDPWFDPYYRGYYRGYYGGGYYGGYYGGYGAGYYDGRHARAYDDHYYRNPYGHGGRSSYSQGRGYMSERTAYGAYKSAQTLEGRGRSRSSYDRSRPLRGGISSYDGYQSQGSSRSSYDSSRGSESRSRSSFDSYGSESRSRSSQESGSSSRSGGGSYSSPSRSSGGGSSGSGRYDAPTRRR